MLRMLAIAICLTVLITAVAADQIVSVYVDGHEKNFDPAARVQDGRTYAPLRASAESVGATVKWMAQQQMAVVCQDQACVAIQRSDGIIVDDHLLVPLRLLGEAVGCSVRWDAETRSVRIQTGS